MRKVATYALSSLILIGCNDSNRSLGTYESTRYNSFDPWKEVRKSPQEIRELVKEVKNGDSDAALELVMYNMFTVPDPTAAYYWALQAKKLDHPDVGDDHIRDIESMIWYDLSSGNVQDGEGFDTLEEAVRSLEREK